MRFFKTQAGACILWIIASFPLAAVLTPHLYNAGKSFAAGAEENNYTGIIASVAGSAGRADSDRYFSRCLLIAAILLLPFLIRRIKSISSENTCGKLALRRLTWRQRLIHFFSGLLVGGFFLGLLALMLNLTGASVPKGNHIGIAEIFTKALFPAICVGLIEEFIFRGPLLCFWLRACSLWKAWLGSALLYSFVHFLKPPSGMEITDPTAWYSGFEILMSTLLNFINPEFFVTEFATLVLLGLILAYCRTKTFSLWLSIGIHAGLVFALKTFAMSRDLIPDSSLTPWFIGSDLKSGVLPLLFLGMCFIICVPLVKKLNRASL